MRILFEVAGDVQINRELLRVGAHATDASPAFAAIGDLLMTVTEQQFQTEGRHASGGWTPLKPRTVLAKEQLGLRPQILQATGSLLDSLTRKGSPDMVLDVRPHELVYGSAVPYAIYHQKGTRKMPRRRPLEFTEQTRRKAVKILQRYILTGEVGL